MKSKWRNVTVGTTKYKYTTYHRDGHAVGVLAKSNTGDMLLSSFALLKAVEVGRIPQNQLQYGCKPGVISPAVVAEAIKLRLAERPMIAKKRKKR